MSASEASSHSQSKETIMTNESLDTEPQSASTQSLSAESEVAGKDEVSKSVAPPRYITSKRKPTTALLPNTRAVPSKTVNRKANVISTADLVAPSANKKFSEPILAIDAPNTTGGGPYRSVRKCHQCAIHESTLKLKDKEMEDMKIEHGIHEHRMTQAAEMWDRQRLRLEAESSKAKNQARICEHFHMSKAQHQNVVDGLEKELAAALEEISILKSEIARLMKQPLDDGIVPPDTKTSVSLEKNGSQIGEGGLDDNNVRGFSSLSL